MASKTSNIQLPDGSTISIPAWASESTMDQIAGFMAATNKVDQKFLTLMKGMGADVGALQKSIQEVVQPIKKNSSNVAKAKEDDLDLAKGIRGTANSIMKASKFFGNSSTPLSGMVDATKSLKDGMGEAMPEFISSLTSGASETSSGLQALGAVTDVAVDAGLAYLGWNAAKMEQFAEAQGKMIDAGAIFYESGDQFDLLYNNSLAAGVTYNSMIDSASQFSGAMLGIGGSMSAGTAQFITMFEKLNDSTDNLGDLGFLSKDLMGGFAEFIDYSRLSGTLNRQLANDGELLRKSFIDLQIESAGLANLTSLSRSEAMRRKLDALTDPLIVLGTSKLEDGGLPGTADVVRNIAGSLGRIAPDAQVFQMILDGFAQEVGEITDPANFDMAKRLDSPFRAALEKAAPNLISDVNEMVRSGSASADDANRLVFDALMNMNLESIQSSGAVSGSTLKYITELQAAGHTFQRNFKAYNELSQEERDNLADKTADGLGKSGVSVTMMNKATEQFLALQNTMTADMQSTYEMFDKVADYMVAGADKLKNFLGLPDEEDDGFGGQYGGVGTPGAGHATDYNLGIVDQDLHDRAAAARNRLASRYGRTRMPQAERAELQVVIDQDALVNTVQVDSPTVVDDSSTDVTVEENNENNVTVDTGTPTVTAQQAWYQIKGARDLLPRGDRRTELNNLMNRINKSSTTPQDASAILAEANLNGVSPQNRRMGGPVTANQPYIVGDQLGMDTAELFVPDTSGNIVNNRDLNTMINNIVSDDQAGLTNNSSSAIIEELKKEYQSLIESKTQTVQAMSALKKAIGLFNDNKNRQSRIDIINSV